MYYIFNNFDENITSIFQNRVEQVERAIKQIISSYETVLEQQEVAYKETLEQCKAEKAWLSQQRRELEQVQNDVQAILNQSVE